MKHIIRLMFIVLISVPAGTGCSKQPELTAAEENNRWGYRDAGGNWVISPQFILAQEFLLTGIAAVVDDSGWVYIDKKGNKLIRPFIFDNGPDYFSEGLARFTDKNKFGYFDEYGNIVIQPRYDFARPFSKGLAAVCTGGESRQEGEHSRWTGGKWGFIDKKGELVIPLIYDQVEDVLEQQIRVRTGEAWKTINSKGN